MNWDRIQRDRKPVKGRVEEPWLQLTEDDFDIAAGRRNQTSAKTPGSHSVDKDDVEQQRSPPKNEVGES